MCRNGCPQALLRPNVSTLKGFVHISEKMQHSLRAETRDSRKSPTIHTRIHENQSFQQSASYQA